MARATDFRIQLGVLRHVKIRRLRALLGGDGFCGWVALIDYATSHRPSGDLGDLTVAEVEVLADWTGPPGTLVASLRSVGLLDVGPPNADTGMAAYALHDWADWQPWVAGADDRSESARKAGRRSAEARAKRPVERPEEPLPYLPLPFPPLPKDTPQPPASGGRAAQRSEASERHPPSTTPPTPIQPTPIPTWVPRSLDDPPQEAHEGPREAIDPSRASTHSSRTRGIGARTRPLTRPRTESKESPADEVIREWNCLATGGNPRLAKLATARPTIHLVEQLASALREPDTAQEIADCLRALEREGLPGWRDGRLALAHLLRPTVRQGILEGVTTGAGEGLATSQTAEQAARELAATEAMIRFVDEEVAAREAKPERDR